MKTLFGISSRGIRAAAVPAIFAFASAMQAQTLAVMHGKVTNPAGQPLNHGEVKLTADKTVDAKDRKYTFSFPIDKDGNYSGKGITPGSYNAVVFADEKTPDFQDVSLKFGDDKTVDFDMTRPEYISKMSSEEKAALEAYKKKNASATAENSKIADINKTLIQARADEKAGKVDDAVKALQGLSQARPGEAVIWASLGDAQLLIADAAFKAARDAKTSTNDPAIQGKYLDAATSYQKSIEANPTSQKPSQDLIASSNLNEGTALAKAGKMKESAAAYDASAKVSPAAATLAYDNEAATLFNMQKTEEATPAAEKAIAADPKKAINYYIKGQSLVGKATLDPKTSKFVLPPGCLEAYQKYLELDPNGQFSKDTRELLANLGQQVTNSVRGSKR